MSVSVVFSFALYTDRRISLFMTGRVLVGFSCNFGSCFRKFGLVGKGKGASFLLFYFLLCVSSGT